AQCHADADLARPQTRAEGNDAVNADDGEREADETHAGGLNGADAEDQIPEDARQRLAHRPQIGDRHVRRHRDDLSLDPWNELRGIAFGADVQRAHRIVALNRQIDERSRGLEDERVLAVARDADDLDHRIGWRVHAQSFSDWILPGPESGGHRLVDD